MCRNTDGETSWFVRVLFQTGAIDARGTQPLNQPLTVFSSDCAQHRDADSKLCKSARRDCGAATRFTIEVPGKRLLAEFGKYLKTAENLVDKKLTNYDHRRSTAHHVWCC